MLMLTLDKIYHAAFVLREAARKTDLIAAPNLGSRGELYLKTENLQNTGSFKLRGAYYKISQLTEEERSRGIIACSAGNHAQGVALAASKNGIRSVICMPSTIPWSSPGRAPSAWRFSTSSRRWRRCWCPSAAAGS